MTLALASLQARLGDVLRATARALAAGGVELPALEARLLVGHALALSREARLMARIK